MSSVENFSGNLKRVVMSPEDSVLVAHRIFDHFIEDSQGALAERVDALRLQYQDAIESDQTDLVSLLLDELLELIDIAAAKGTKINDQMVQEYIETDIPAITEKSYQPELERSFIKILFAIGVSKEECLQYYDLSNAVLKPEIEEKVSGIFEIIDEEYGET